MGGLYVLKNESTEKYYSNDKEFIEPNKKYAKKLRMAQAQALQREYNKWSGKPNIAIEPL